MGPRGGIPLPPGPGGPGGLTPPIIIGGPWGGPPGPPGPIRKTKQKNSQSIHPGLYSTWIRLIESPIVTSTKAITKLVIIKSVNYQNVKDIKKEVILITNH